jgi:GMP synthase (glutamine-hydrolysing)
MKPVLIVDCYLDADPGAPYYARWLTRPHVAWRAPYAGGAPSLDGFSGVVLTGSKGSLVDHEPWMDGVVALTRRALDADVPILGCCFGHQLLGVATAGAAGIRKRDAPEVGFLPIDRMGSDPVLDTLAPTFEAFVTHEDEVVPQPGITVLARSEVCDVHALRVVGRRAWGVQFHVEYPRAEQDRILRYRAERHPELGLDPDALMAAAPDTDAQARTLFAAFEAQLGA